MRAWVLVHEPIKCEVLILSGGRASLQAGAKFPYPTCCFCLDHSPMAAGHFFYFDGSCGFFIADDLRPPLIYSIKFRSLSTKPSPPCGFRCEVESTIDVRRYQGL